MSVDARGARSPVATRRCSRARRLPLTRAAPRTKPGRDILVWHTTAFIELLQPSVRRCASTPLCGWHTRWSTGLPRVYSGLLNRCTAVDGDHQPQGRTTEVHNG